MREGPEVSVLVHELGGILSSVQGFAHIAEANPAHPDRERFIKLAAAEARRAAQTLKDLHLARALDRGTVAASPPPVEMTELMAPFVQETAGAGLHPAGGRGVMVRVDPAKLAALVARCIEASQTPPEMRMAGADPVLVIALGPAAELDRRRAALDAPYPEMVLFSLTRRLVECWGGDLTIGAEDDRTVVAIRLPAA
ncbi:MAG: hypothetical protein ABR613_00860 [Actinomycetota bacterium]